MAEYARIIVDPPRDVNLGRLRARTPAQVRQMTVMRDAGVPVAAIARHFRIGKRSVYRYLQGGDAIDVVIGRWTATFTVDDDRTPVRVSDWRRA